MSNTINILAVGDVVSASGCEKLRNCLPKFKRENNIDVTVVNGENSAVGNGILPMSADDIFTSGADVVTGGNHTFRRREIYDELERNEFLLRPANYGKEAPGRGYTIVDRGAYRVGVVNLCGTVFMEPLENPFICIDRVLEKPKSALWAFILTEGFRLCLELTPMCPRQTSKYCRTVRDI